MDPGAMYSSYIHFLNLQQVVSEKLKINVYATDSEPVQTYRKKFMPPVMTAVSFC